MSMSVPDDTPIRAHLYDGCYDSLDPMQRLMEAHYSGRGEDGHRKNWLDANPEPRGSDVIHCTHSENERCTGYLWCLSRKKGPFEEGMTCIGKEEKWKRGWHGPYDDELPDHNKWGCGQANLMKADRRSERDQYGTFCSHKSDKFCTRPSWCLSREDWLFKPGGSDSHGGDGFPDGLPNEHKDALQQQYGNYYGNYYMRNAGSGWGLLRGGHGDDVEHQSSPPEPYQPTVEDAPDVNAYLDRFEQGRSSQAAEDRQQSTDDGLGRFRAMHANSRAEDEEAEARFKMYLEATRQDHRRLEEAKAVERVLCQKRADLERCDAQRATTETRPQAEQVPVQPYEDRGGKGKARAATNDNAHPREEASLLEQHLNEEMKRLKQEHECLEEANDRLKEGTERLIRETGRLNEEETRGLNRLEDEQSPTIQ
ncbi:hypothetical protein E8E11_005610 [Didymella keratinophila]|nr:hypothetical protein E8E11_005610 [Didymella keratinophila]